ncbi:anti-sigma factor [Aureimonas sp. ME7]|uniref:anti-sigma factor n=1 Tax=Aureimonas sp. ME7 TaxID=2744252 RepID=UPI0015F4F917|nr:anti-sigma factor [Aureimonas sp. ME7]
MSAGDGKEQEGHETLAGEYALGLLTPMERRAAERRMLRDRALASEVAAWEARLHPLAASVEPVSPPARLWQAIEEELGPAVRPARSASPPAAARRRVAAFWQWLAIGSMGLAAASLAGLALTLSGPLPAAPPTLTASIAPEGGAPLFVAVIDPGSGQATLMPVALGMGNGRVPELWLVPAGGAPISLGLMNPAAPLRMNLHDHAGMEMMRTPGAALAVSMEPEGGSPTGQPTGPVVGQGALHEI